MGAFNIDANGQIIVDDSMSEELKEKIRIYNGCLNSPDINDVEISEEEADRFDVPDDPEDSFPTIRGVGESRLNIQGLRMTITEWVNDKDITVRFDDGTELQHKRYSKFGSGGIQNPNARIITGANIEDVRGANSRLGKSRFNTQGLRMTIIKYRSSRDIDVQFEDGTIVEHKRYSLFEKGYIENPHYKTSFFGSMLIDNLAYIYNDTSNFYCHCTKCICKDIMTISEMRLHICSI